MLRKLCGYWNCWHYTGGTILSYEGLSRRGFAYRCGTVVHVSTWLDLLVSTWLELPGAFDRKIKLCSAYDINAQCRCALASHPEADCIRGSCQCNWVVGVSVCLSSCCMLQGYNYEHLGAIWTRNSQMMHGPHLMKLGTQSWKIFREAKRPSLKFSHDFSSPSMIVLNSLFVAQQKKMHYCLHWT